MADIELQGRIEKVLFSNADNGYAVLVLQCTGNAEVQNVTAVGTMLSPRAGETLNIEIPVGSRVMDLALLLGIPEPEIRTAFVNGRARNLDRELEPGDEVGIFPAVGGG